MKTEVITLTSNPNVTLTSYLLDPLEGALNATIRPAVIVLPGGAYRMLSNREAEPVAMAFLTAGYHAFVLRYTIGETAEFSQSLKDAEEALELVGANAAEWGIHREQIAVCGFSAGGHLAAALGTMGRLRPNALILGYPCILESISRILAFPVPSLDKAVDARTPPTFIFSTANDLRVPVSNSLAFAAALDAAQIPFEVHIFQDGVHGLSLAKPHTSLGNEQQVNPIAAVWMELCLVWLDQLFARASD